MRWHVLIGLIWFLMVPAALCFNLIAQYRASRRNRQALATMRRIERLIVVVVETWGKDPEHVRSLLQDVILKEN